MKHYRSLVGGLIILLIIASAVFIGKAREKGVVNENERRASPQIVAYVDKQWPIIERIRLEGDNALYSIKGSAVYRNGSEINGSGDKDSIDRVSRVGYFYWWMKQDPIFFGEHFDNKDTIDTIKRLSAAQKTFKEARGLKDNFFAIEFLNSFVRSSQAFDVLDKDISETNAKKLLSAVEQANSDYGYDLSSLKTVLDGFSTSTQTFVFLDGSKTSDIHVVIDDMKVMMKNYEESRTQIEERGNCLLRSKEDCRAPILAIGEPKNFTEQANQPVLLSPEELHFRKGVDNQGPYRIEGQCWAGGSEQYLYTGTECPGNLDYCFEKSTLANTAFYIEIPKNFAPYKVFADKDIKVIPQSATTPYDCMDLEYQSKLSGLNVFFEQYKNDLFFKKITERTDISGDIRNVADEGLKAEEKLFNNRYPSDKELEYLNNFYGYAYGRLIALGYDKPTEMNDLLNRYIEGRQNLSNFYLLANKAGFHFLNLLASLKTFAPGVSASPPIYIYPIRSHYSLMYLNASPNVWRIAEKPRYMLDQEATPEAKRQGNIKNRDYIVNKYGIESVLAWQKMYNEIMPFAHDNY